MSFQEIFKRFREGTATEAEQREVREEIAKYEQINDYLCEQLEWEGEAEGNAACEQGETKERRRGSADEEQAREFTRIIQKSIRRAFLKFGMVLTAVFLAILLFFQFGLSPLMDRLYYDPGEMTGETANRLTMDLSVYGEVHDLPVRGYDAAVYDKGYGTYDIRINQTWSTDRSFESVGGTIRRGHLTLYQPNLLKTMSVNVFADVSRNGQEDAQWAAGTPEQAKAALFDLDEKESYQAYITFDRDLSFPELKQFEKDNDLGVWGAVRTRSPGFGNFENLGFFTSRYSTYLFENWDQDRYPELFLGTAEETGEGGRELPQAVKQLEQKKNDEETMKTHFLSSLRYLADNQRFLSLVEDVTPGFFRDYEGAGAYVEEHGLAFYGCSVRMGKEELIKLADKEHVYGIYVGPVYH